MRLIHIESLELVIFDREENTPEYAILSHTWAEDGSEVDIREFEAHDSYSKAGWAKIDRCCQKARKDGWQYVWIDTCCIDKSSSAELSEAINSMYRYYENSAICYAHLEDVRDGPRLNQELRNSRWFTRGWTLQELLAPKHVVFLDHSWSEIGTRSSLKSIIKSITGVDLRKDYRQASVAQRFSWAANRKTTRIEDQAYSLLGMFGIHMPLLYGEGEKAFRRLQEEIVKVSSDESIFAWTNRYKNMTQFGECDIPWIPALAPHIECFKDCRHVNVCERYQRIDLAGLEDSDPPEGLLGFSMTKNAIKINTLLYCRDFPSSRKYCALLNCRKGQSRNAAEPWEKGKERKVPAKRLAIYLEESEGTFFRSSCDIVLDIDYPIIHAERKMLYGWRRLGLQEITIFNEHDQQTIPKLSLEDSVREEYLVTIQLSKSLEQQFLSASWATDLTGDHEERMQIRFDLPNNPHAPYEFRITDGEYAPMWVRVKGSQERNSKHIFAVGVRLGSIFISLTKPFEGELRSFSCDDPIEGLMPDMIEFYPNPAGRAKVRAELCPRPSRSPRYKEHVLHITYHPHLQGIG